MKNSMTVLLAGACIAGWCAEDMHRLMTRERGIDLPPAVKAADWMERPAARQLLSVSQHGLLSGSRSRADPNSTRTPGLESEHGETDKVMNFLKRGKFE